MPKISTTNLFVFKIKGHWKLQYGIGGFNN